MGLQDLADFTKERFFSCVDLVGRGPLRLYWKRGMDGYSGQGLYNQELAGQSGWDSSNFLICVVPI